MGLSAVLAAFVAAMCALCRRPVLAGKRRCILTYMWPSYHEVFAAGHYRLMAYREQYIPQSAGECRRVPSRCKPLSLQTGVCLQAAACLSCSSQAMVVATNRQVPPHLSQAPFVAASSVSS